jgi:hypothetical protein
MQQNNYQLLLQKLDQFIRKYYVNKLIKGSLISVGLLLISFIAFTLLEYYYFKATYSSTFLRKGLYYSFLVLSTLTLGSLVFKPLLQYFSLGKVISHKKAAQIIGAHFQNVQDKLLNVIQLKEQASESDTALLEASINQKTKNLKPIPFSSAINLKENKKHLRYALPPMLLLFLLLFSSNIIEESTGRIINNNKDFERDALFNFSIEKDRMQVVQYSNFELEVQVNGEALPDEVFVEFDNYKYKLDKKSPNTFSYTFIELRKDTRFNLYANGLRSKYYEIDVLEKPQISDFEIELDYPAYTARRNESIKGIGDLVVPVGTTINWLFKSINTNKLSIQFPGETQPTATNQVGEQNFNLRKKILKEGRYIIYISNEDLPEGDSVLYSMTLIPDLYPSIDVKSSTDSLQDKIVYFVGEASDDYGLKQLNFHYSIERESQLLREDKIAMTISKGKQTTYEYILDVNTLDLQAGDKLSYYFKVFDNDAVNGSKSAQTTVMYYKMPSVEELKKTRNNQQFRDQNEFGRCDQKNEKIGGRCQKCAKQNFAEKRNELARS